MHENQSSGTKNDDKTPKISSGLRDRSDRTFRLHLPGRGVDTIDTNVKHHRVDQTIEWFKISWHDQVAFLINRFYHYQIENR